MLVTQRTHYGPIPSATCIENATAGDAVGEEQGGILYDGSSLSGLIGFYLMLHLLLTQLNASIERFPNEVGPAKHWEHTR